MIPEITFQYYLEGSPVKQPPMSDRLFTLIQKAVEEVGASKCHIVHVGTVGDRKHSKKTSYHCKTPPRAIDICKVHLKWENGREIILVPRDSIKDRELIAQHWDGRALHLWDDNKHHVHLDTKGAE